MKKRIYSSIAVVITLALLFVLKVYVSEYFFDAFFGIIACFAGFEISKMLTKMGKYNFQFVAVIFPTLLLVANLLGMYFASTSGDFFWIFYTILINISLMIIVFSLLYLWGIILKKKTLNEITVRQLKNISIFRFSFNKALNTLITFIYPSFFFLFFILINHFNTFNFIKLSEIQTDISVFMLLTAFLIPIFTDTFAMLTGSLIGGKKLCPKISPNKTISGAVGGTLWCVLFSACVYLIFGCIESFIPFMEIFPIWAYLIIVLLGSIIAQCGDIFESFIKRRANVKDSGKFLPGHGGCLDRIDSHIFVAPFILIAFLIFVVV